MPGGSPYRLKVMAIYFAQANLDVAFSRNKRKVRRFAKRHLRFGDLHVRVGTCTWQVFASKDRYIDEFGYSMIYDLDQRLVFRPDFSVARRLTF